MNEGFAKIIVQALLFGFVGILLFSGLFTYLKMDTEGGYGAKEAVAAILPASEFCGPSASESDGCLRSLIHPLPTKSAIAAPAVGARATTTSVASIPDPRLLGCAEEDACCTTSVSTMTAKGYVVASGGCAPGTHEVRLACPTSVVWCEKE